MNPNDPNYANPGPVESSGGPRRIISRFYVELSVLVTDADYPANEAAITGIEYLANASSPEHKGVRVAKIVALDSPEPEASGTVTFYHVTEDDE